MGIETPMDMDPEGCTELFHFLKLFRMVNTKFSGRKLVTYE